MNLEQEARTVFFPALALLALSVACWLAVMPIRDEIAGGNDSFLMAFLEGVTVAIFIGGLEAVCFNTIPVTFFDGLKLWQWNKLAWAGLMGVSAFLFWQVLLNDQRSYYDAINDTSTQIALIVAGVCLGLTVTTWLFFRFLVARRGG
jgi:hypothetical protein